MNTFKYGEKVTHPLHGKGKVGNSYPEQDLVDVYFEDDYQSSAYGTLVHPVSLTAFVDPWRPVTVKWTSGVTTHTRVRSSEVVQYLKNLPMEQIATFDLGVAE
jgi:hypothetical protein